MTVINLARECNLLSILPAAFYLCCWHASATDIFRGVLLDNGTRCIMSPADQEACITGRFTLLETQANKTWKWLHPTQALVSCHTPEKCRTEREALFWRIWYPVPKLHALSPSVELQTCTVCTQKAKELHNAGRRSVWEDLPSVFGLPEWEELKRQP